MKKKFWAVILTVLMLVGVIIPGGLVYGQAGDSGNSSAIYTTDSEGTQQDGNIYDLRKSVYLKTVDLPILFMFPYSTLSYLFSIILH